MGCREKGGEKRKVKEEGIKCCDDEGKRALCGRRKEEKKESRWNPIVSA